MLEKVIAEHSKSAKLMVQHKKVLIEHTATLNSGTVNRAVNNENSKSTTSNTKTWKQCNINTEIRNSMTLKQCNLK